MLEIFPALQRLAVAVLIGLLIGVDRERTEPHGGRPRFAGVRTFPIIALAGAVPMLVPHPAGLVLLIASFLAVAAVALIAYWHSSVVGEVGATTEMAALATFLLGTLAGSGQLVVAGATGVGVAVLLVAKLRLESFSRAMAREELWAVLELAVLTVIVLPLLPNRGFGPWKVLNPFEIWLVVVLVTALSFVGFIAMRLLGERRGMAVTGFVGGLVSSTAVTLSMAERSRAEATLGRPASAAVAVASAMMCARVAVLAGVINPGILPRLVPSLAAMAMAGAGAAWLLGRHPAVATALPGRRLTNPFSLRAALSFAAIYALVLLGVRAAREWLGDAGLFAAAALAGLGDLDAPTVAFARLGPQLDGWRASAAAVMVAAVANSFVKMGLAIGLGSGSFRRYAAVALVAMAVAGGLVAALVYARP